MFVIPRSDVEMNTSVLVSILILMLVAVGSCKDAVKGQDGKNSTTKISTDQLIELVRLQENRIRLLEKSIAEVKESCQQTTVLTDDTNIPLQALRGTRQLEGFVGFTAYLDHDITHLGVGQTIVYDKIILNERGGYNPTTGHFTCPIAGFYAFSFTVYVNSTTQIVAKLRIDGVNMVDGIADAYHPLQEIQGGNFLVTRLNAGQVVSVTNNRWPDKEVDSSNYNHMASFTGFRIG